MQQVQQVLAIIQVVDEGVLPPYIPSLIPGTDYFRYYPAGTGPQDDQEGAPAYVLKWGEEYDRQIEEDRLKAVGFTSRLGGQDPPRAQSSQRSSSRRDLPPRAQSPQRAPQPDTRRQLPGDIRLRESDCVDENCRWTETTINGKSVTWISAPGAYQEQAWSGWTDRSRGGYSGGGSSGSSGSSGNTDWSQGNWNPRGDLSRDEPSGKRRTTSKNKITKRVDSQPAGPVERLATVPEAAPTLGEDASAKATTKLQFQHIVELADGLQNRLLRKAEDEGDSAPFTTSTATLLALVNALTTSRNCGQAVISERESASLLEKLQRLDRENPTLDSAQTRAKAKAKARPYSTAASHVPPSPPEQTPDPGAISWVYQGRRIWRNPVSVSYTHLRAHET